MKRLTITVAIVLSLIGTAGAERKVALKFFRAGEKAYKAQQFATAAQNFYEAYKELPLPEIAFSAAQAYRRQFRIDQSPDAVRRSVELYTFYLAKVKEGGRVGDAADSLGEMTRELEKLGGAKLLVEPTAVRTQLGVTVNLAGLGDDQRMDEIDDASRAADAVEVKTWIDGKLVPPDKMMEVAPGEHVVRAEAAGFAPNEQKHPAPEGHSELVELQLKALPANVTIVTERDARISIDGRGVGTAPVPAVELAAGRHVLTIVRSGRRPVLRELVVTRGQAVTVTEPLESTARRKSVKIVAGVAIGLGVITLVTGGAALYQNSEAQDLLVDLRTGNHPPGTIGVEYASARDLRDQLVTGTWVAGAATVGVGLAAGFLYYFDTPSAEGLRVAPIAGGGASGAQVIGRF